MNTEREEILEKLRNVKQTATQDLAKTDENKSEVVQNVNYLGTIELQRRDGEEADSFELYTVEVYDYDSDKIETKIYLDGQEVDMGELMRTYENIEPIKDVVSKAKENQEKDSDKKNQYDLNEMEEEKIREYAGIAGKDKENIKKVSEIDDEEIEVKEDEEQVDDKKLASVNHLQEMKATTRVNNYETLSGVLGLSGISKFVVVYSEDAAEISKTNGENKNRNNSTYSIIAIKNDGTAINIDNKLEQSRSEGTNSSEGRVQTNADGTTQKEYHQASIYNIKGTNRALSLENDNYGEIQVYYGAMTKGALDNEGNQFVGTQLETRSVWPTSRDVRAQEDYRKGEYNADQKADEVKKHLKHGDEKIENINNADGDKRTIADCENDLIPNTDTTWREFANICGYRGEDAIEKAMKEFENYKKDYPDSSNEEIIEEIQEEIENEMPGPNRDRR